MFRVFLFLVPICLLSSCFKEKAIPPIDISTLGKTFTAKMGANYTQQIYFNLQTAEFVGENSRFEYDLAFDCTDNNFMIWLNGAKVMQATKSGKKNMNDVVPSDTLNKFWQVEFGYGLPDSSALKKWGNYPASDEEVYLIKLGTDNSERNLGIKKLQILNFTSAYNLRYANLDGSDMRSISIPKDNTKQWIFYSMLTHQIKNLEPVKDNWDLVFTVYSTYFYAEKLPYAVVGTLTNTTRTQAYLLDSTSTFTDVTLSRVDLSRFSQRRDGVGYEWKQYEYGEYMIKPSYIFIVRSEGKFYKLHFLDFYLDGTKGYPKFEYEELK